jgi:hypothetical protein
VQSIPESRKIDRLAACILDQQRFHLMSQFGISVRQQSSALIGSALASRVK